MNLLIQLIDLDQSGKLSLAKKWGTSQTGKKVPNFGEEKKSRLAAIEAP